MMTPHVSHDDSATVHADGVHDHNRWNADRSTASSWSPAMSR